jgi:hypothetical protein
VRLSTMRVAIAIQAWAKPPHNGLASGIPAMGAGWGGPAKGAGSGRQRALAAPLITTETAREMAARSQTAEANEKRRALLPAERKP